MGREPSLDDLVTESRRIRMELLRAAAKLELFSEQLAEHVTTLNTAIGDDNGKALAHTDVDACVESSNPGAEDG